MKVSELIKQLSEMPQDLDVLIWDAGNRSGIASVDDSFINDENPFVELNTDTDDQKIIYIVRNHNGTELGQFNTRDEAVEEAKFYREQTGNATYIEEQSA
jgi:NADP-dependent 3-hydroxy acid dehydrogenase YdfG